MIPYLMLPEVKAVRYQLDNISAGGAQQELWFPGRSKAAWRPNYVGSSLAKPRASHQGAAFLALHMNKNPSNCGENKSNMIRHDIYCGMFCCE